MKSRPTILVILVIGIHVLASWLVCWQLEGGTFWRIIAAGIVLGELALPAILVTATRSVPILLRFLIVVLCLEAASYQIEQRLYFVLVVFTCQVMLVSFGWTWWTGWRLASSADTPAVANSRGKFSLLQLLATTTAIAIALAAMRTRFDMLRVLKQGGWDEWFVLTSVAIVSFLLVSATLASRRAAIKSLATTTVLCVVFALALQGTRSGGSIFAIVGLIGALSPQLPAIALRLCGWRWVRMRSSGVPRLETAEAARENEVQSSNS